jgi:hypothetical protein
MAENNNGKQRFLHTCDGVAEQLSIHQRQNGKFRLQLQHVVGNLLLDCLPLQAMQKLRPPPSV